MNDVIIILMHLPPPPHSPALSHGRIMSLSCGELVQVALAIRGFAIRGFDYSHQIYVEHNHCFMQ